MPDASEPTDRYFKIAALRRLLTFDKGGKGSSFDLNTSASMNSKVQKATWVFSGLIIFALAGALYNISFTHGQRDSDVAMIGGALQNRRLAPGLALQKVYKHSAESAAPDSVLPPAANSLWIAFSTSLGMLGGCMGMCAASMSMQASARGRAPRPQADPEQATPVPAEAAIKAKIARIVQDFQEAIQEANEALGREPTAVGQQVEKIRRVVYNCKNAVHEANAALGRESTGAFGEQMDRLIVDLGINLPPSRAAHAVGAGANAARKDLVPSAPSGRPGKGAGKGTETVNDASEPAASETAGPKVGEKNPAVSEPPKSGAAEPEVDEKKSAAEEVPDDEKIDTCTRNFTLICKVWRSKKKLETVTK